MSNEEMNNNEASSGNQARRQRQGGTRGLTGAVILISLGVVLLLNNFGVTDINPLSLIKYWPVLLILAGLDLMFGRRSVVASIFTAIVALAVVLGLAFFVARSSGATETVTYPFEQELGDVTELEIHLQLGAIDAEVDGFTSGSLAAEGTFQTSQEIELVTEYEERGTTGVLTINQDVSDSIRFADVDALIGELRLKVNEEVPVEFIVEAGAGNTILILTDLTLSELNLDGGVGNFEVFLPDSGDYEVTVDVGVANVEITIPPGVEARLQLDRGLSTLDVPSRFERVSEGVWETSGYGDAENQVLLDVNVGVSNLEIR